MVQPLDIKTQKFKKGLFGYKTIDVDGFVNSVYRAYDDVFKENETLKESVEKLNASLQENRLKMFELETKIQELESVSTYNSAPKAEPKKEEAPKQEEKKATIKFKPQETKKEEPKKEEPKEKVSSSNFFKKDETKIASANDDDDEIFVGEIEDAAGDSNPADHLRLGLCGADPCIYLRQGVGSAFQSRAFPGPGDGWVTGVEHAPRIYCCTVRRCICRGLHCLADV